MSIKRGTIFKNNFASLETYFMYQYASGQYAVGIGVYKNPEDTKWTHHLGQKYYLQDIRNNREGFSVVGYAPVKEMEVLPLEMLDAAIEDASQECPKTIQEKVQDLYDYVEAQYQSTVHWDDDKMRGMALAYQKVMEELQKLLPSPEKKQHREESVLDR